MKETSIVRNNLMNEEGYAPYCGSNTCIYRLKRTTFNVIEKQFSCSCGWKSSFPIDFIKRYIKKWDIKLSYKD